MNLTATDFDQLLTEYAALSRQHGKTQMRCSEVITQQRRQMDAQQKQIMQLRAAVIVSSSALAFAQADMTHLEVKSPGQQNQALEACLVAADLVICQTGCLSHGEYWRVQDHCKRTGKACVLVEQPETMRIVRIHRPEATATT